MLLSFVLSFISIFLYFSFSYAQEIKISIEGLHSMEQKEFLYLLGLDKGKYIDPDVITEGIKRVFLKDIFDDIVIEKKDKDIYIKVKEKPFIKSINFENNKYFSQDFLNKFITFKKGEKLKNIELKNSKTKIEETLKKLGFIQCKVDVKKECINSFCNITFLIFEGSPLIIKNIKWTGDKDEYIQSFLKLSPNEPFDQNILEEFIKKAQNYYEKQNIVGTEISYAFVNNELIINLKKGKAIEIEILGANSLSKGDLFKIIKPFFKDKIDEIIIKDSVNSIISFYRINGFIDVKVYPLMEQSEETLKILYIINEGKRRSISQVEIKYLDANEILEKDEVTGIIINNPNSYFNPDEMETDRQRIEEYLRSKGYYYVKVYPAEIQEEDEKIRILFKIHRGHQIKIKFLNFKVIDDILKENSIKLLEEFQQKTFNESIILEIKRKIREIYVKEGYFDAKVDVYYEIKDNEAHIDISVDPQSKRYFGKSIILGNKKTKTKFIYERLHPKDNMPYNPFVLEEERQILYRSGLFSRLDINHKNIDDSIDIIYNIEEAPAGAFEFGFGYGEYERFKGFAEFSYINLFGMNKQIFSRVELSQLEKRSYITYIDPWFWKDLIFKSSLTYENTEFKNIDTKDILYKLKRYGVSAGFEKNFLDYFKGEILYEATYSKIWDMIPDVIISDIDIGEIFISGIKASLIYDSRDNPFDPKKGWLAGFTSKLSNKFFGSEINFMKTSFYINKYTELIKNIVLATSLRGGWSWLYGKTENLPISERYFLGGRDTVRGYAQNTLGPKQNNQPTGGNAFLMGNIEFRTYLGQNFFIVNFLDFGNVWSRVGDIDIPNFKYTTGVGLRYKTPVGPVRIDYGFKLNREKGESRGEIHFSIGHAF